MGNWFVPPVVIPGALVLAVHEDYLSTPEFQEAESFLETRILIPAFEDHAEHALGHILERRMTVQGLKSDSSDVFHEGALEALADFYREADCNLRKVIWVSRAALRYAWVDNAELVTRVHMEAAVAEATEGSYHRA